MRFKAEKINTDHLIDYNGFQIDKHRFLIYKNGIQVFTAYWQMCDTLEEAMALIDESNKMKEKQAQPDTNFDHFQANKYGNVLPEPVVYPDGEFECGAEAAERQAEWVHMQHEQQLHSYER